MYASKFFIMACALLAQTCSSRTIPTATTNDNNDTDVDFQQDPLNKRELNPTTAITVYYENLPQYQAVKAGTALRILPVGDSITVGFGSSDDGGDGNGYRERLKEELAQDTGEFVGTQSSGTMQDGYYAAWSGKTIQYIADNVGPSLKENPNIILLEAGTNDMSSDSSISQQGNDPQGAADRLGALIDQMIEACPDAAILVSIITPTCVASQSERTAQFQALVPGVVQKRRDANHRVLAVDFSKFSLDLIRSDCIHPTNEGYQVMGEWWYDFIQQIPKDWIQ